VRKKTHSLGGENCSKKRGDERRRGRVGDANFLPKSLPSAEQKKKKKKKGKHRKLKINVVQKARRGRQKGHTRNTR